MLAIIGFIALLGLGLYFVAVTVTLWFGGQLFGNGGGVSLIPAAVAVAVLWLAFHLSPFTVAFTG